MADASLAIALWRRGYVDGYYKREYQNWRGRDYMDGWKAGRLDRKKDNYPRYTSATALMQKELF